MGAVQAWLGRANLWHRRTSPGTGQTHIQWRGRDICRFLSPRRTGPGL